MIANCTIPVLTCNTDEGLDKNHGTHLMVYTAKMDLSLGWRCLSWGSLITESGFTHNERLGSSAKNAYWRAKARAACVAEFSQRCFTDKLHNFLHRRVHIAFTAS